MSKAKTSKEQKPCKALELLESGVIATLNSEEFKKALEFKSTFHNYSFTNICLVLQQMPTASLIAGFGTWKKKKRSVKKGEKGIAILAPLIRKIENEKGDKELHVFGFKDAYVFDVSQTEGEDVPTCSPELLTGDTVEIRCLALDSQRYAETQGFSVSFEDTGEAKGWYQRTTNKIAIKQDMPPLQTLKTLVHEIAHGKMHQVDAENTPREIKELEAESCAYVACYTLGLDTSDYSFKYLASWGVDTPIKDIMQAAEKGAKVALEICKGLGAIDA